MSTKVKILIGVGALAIILLVSGLAYAYFVANIGGTGTNINVTAANLQANYQEGETINVSGIDPGWDGSKNFTITNTGTKAINYELNWKTLTNTFVNKSLLVYRIENGSTGTCPIAKPDEPVPNSGTNIQIAKGAIAASTTISCKAVFTYKSVSTDQSSDMGANFSGKFEVRDQSLR